MADTWPTNEQSRPSIGERTENYRRWRERLAETQEDLRRDLEEDTGPTVNPMWSPQALFGPVPDVLDLDEAAASHSVDLVELTSASTGSPPDQEGGGRAIPTTEDSRLLAEQLVDLNRLRVVGEISDAEFNQRKADLFAAHDRSTGAGATAGRT